MLTFNSPQRRESSFDYQDVPRVNMAGLSYNEKRLHAMNHIVEKKILKKQVKHDGLKYKKVFNSFMLSMSADERKKEQKDAADKLHLAMTEKKKKSGNRLAQIKNKNMKI